MDSISNLPLLEITAEDDSLLFDGDAATTSSASNAAATAVFSCSPLLSLRSLPRTDGRVGSLDSENVSNATKEFASFKENVNWNNKPEAPKLSVEPQQMKRKKKGGGYNLRKSLAWDRAFSTEDGVLNPLELSMISGTVTPKRINTELKAIYEEEPASASSALREIEENLFKQSSDGGAACLEDRNNGAVGLTPKSRSSIKDRVTPSLAKRKVLAVNDVVGNMSKRNAYPPRVALSSLKRPESAKAPNKESKVTKIPAPKSNVSGIKTAARSGTLSTCLPKRNQSDYPATNVQKYSGAKGLLKNPRTASTDPKVDMANKCSVTRTLKKQAGKHLDSIVSETRPVLHPPGTGTQKVSEACLTLGVSDTSEKKEPRKFQTTKPSGLRLPSPSLGFFSQAKPSSSQSQLQKSSKTCKLTESNIPKLRKLEMHSVNEARLPPAPRKRSELVEGVTNNCTKKLSLSGVKSEPSMQIDNIQIAGGEVECDSLDSEKINKQEIVDIKQTAGLAVECHSLSLENPSGLLHQTVWGESIQGIPYKNVEQVDESARDFGKLGGDSSAFLLNGNLSLNGNDPSRSTLEIASLQLQGKQINTPNLSIVEEFISENESQGNSCKPVHATTLSSKYSPEKLIPEIDCACESEPNVAESEDCQHLVDDHDQSVVIQRRSVDEGCHQVIDSKELHNRTQAFELDRMYVDPTTVDVTTISFKCSPKKPISEMVSACENEPTTVAESENWQHLLDDQSGFIQIRPLDEGCHQAIDSKVMQNRTQAFELDRMCEDSTSVCVTTYSPPKSIEEIDGACESEPKVAESEDRQQPVDCLSDFIEKRPVDERYNQEPDSEGMSNRTQAFELDRIYEDSTAVHETTLSSKCSPVKSIPEMDRMCEDSTSVHATTYSPPRSIEEIDGACESEPKVAESEDRQRPVDCLSDFIEKRPADERYNQEPDSEGMNNRTQAFELDRIYEDSTAVHVTTLSSKCSPAKSIPEIDGASESENSQHPVDHQSDSIERRPVDERYNLNNDTKVAESEDRQHPVDCLSDFIEKRPVDERYNQEPDLEGMDNRTEAFELDRIYEDSTAVNVTTLTSKCSPAKSIPEIDGACERENCQHPVDLQSDSIERRPVDERYNLNITEGMDNRTQALELDGKCEDSIAVSATVCSTEVNNVSPESRPFYENDIENLHFATQQCSIVKYDGDSSGDDKLICDHRTMSERQHRGDGSSMGTSVCSDVQCNVPGNYVQQTNAFSEQLRENGSSMDTSMHFDVFRDVPGHFEQQADSHTFSEINEMMCEDESLLANHGQLLEESDYSGVTVGFISNKEDSICGSESGLLQLTVLAQSVREFDHTNRESEESPVEDEQAQSFVENPVVCKYENEHCLSATNDQFLLVGDDDISDESHLSGLQRSVGGDENSQHASSIMHLDGDGLLEIIASSEEIKQKDSFEGTSEGCNIYTSENNASDHHTQSVPESTDGNLDMDAEVQCLQISDVKNCCPIILPEVEVQLNHKFISAELDSSIKMTEDSIAEIVNLNSDELCSTENLKLPASDDLPFHSSTPQGSEVNPLNNKIDSQEPEDGIEKDGFCNTDMQNQTEGDLCFEEDSSKLTDIEKSGSKSKPQVPPLKLPPNAVPFSSEWLAAIEAAGEEILTIKSGAVQNSPPEKPQHEPGPWSPVKRKNQTIGPFDCTKHTNIPRSDSP